MAKGDHIYINCGLYTHHGIDCGDGTTIHYTGESLRGIISRTSMNTLTSGKPVSIQHYFTCDRPKIVIERAESRLGENNYNLIFNNCEHFATWCKTGRHESEQVNRVTTATVEGIDKGIKMMNTVNATFVMPNDIEEGLERGKLERSGGVIRDKETKEVVAWLRETNPTIFKGSKLLQLGASASILNLGITVMGFAIINQRLDKIENELQKAQEVLNTINYKIDLGYYANFRGAFDLATHAITMSNKETRINMAIQAIGELRKADHVYTDYFERSLEQKSSIIDEFLLTLILIYVAEFRCYLELEELNLALEFLQKKVKQIRPQIQKYNETSKAKERNFYFCLLPFYFTLALLQ